MKSPRRVTLFAIAGALVLALILLVTLWPTPVDRPYGALVSKTISTVRRVTSWGWFDYASLEHSANILMFVPLAAIVTRVVGARWWLGVAGGCTLLSTSVEIVQLLILPERKASVIDVLANAIGALVGAGFTCLFARRRARRAATQNL